MVILALGTNLGDCAANLRRAIGELGRYGEVVAVSGVYGSDAWGFESGNRFMNIVLTYRTGLSPEALLDCTQEIERRMGRTAKSTDGGYKDRIIDIDLIDYDGMTLSTERLTLPHPLMQERNFVLYPLCDVAPEWVHPLFGQTAAEMKRRSPDSSPLVLLDVELSDGVTA